MQEEKVKKIESKKFIEILKFQSKKEKIEKEKENFIKKQLEMAVIYDADLERFA